MDSCVVKPLSFSTSALQRIFATKYLALSHQHRVQHKRADHFSTFYSYDWLLPVDSQAIHSMHCHLHSTTVPTVSPFCF